MNINWIVRFKNKAFWLSAIPAVLLLATQLAKLFGFDIDLTGISNQLLDVVTTVFTLLALLGVVNDPTTHGISDSERAMTYEKPFRSDANA